MKELDKEYKVEFGHLEKVAWHELISCFQDANLYQTWSYDAVRYGQRGIVHMILKKKDLVVAAAQVRIVQLRVVGAGIAYVLWGPMWRLKEYPDDNEVFRQAIRALKNEFSFRRGFVLRINPQLYRVKDACIEQIFFDDGYQIHNDGKVHRTLIIDLEASLEDLRTALDQKWRNCLNRAEKNGLELILGEEEYLFDEFKKIYDEMAMRKELVELADLNYLKSVQMDLPKNLHMKVILCRLDGELCAGAIFSAIGNLGVYLSGATSKLGMKTNGSYIIQWTFVTWLKENGFHFYDLNGINPNTNPGTYRFKRGLAGKHGNDIEFLGKFQVADSQISSFVVKVGEWLMSSYRQIVQTRRFLRNSSNKGL